MTPLRTGKLPMIARYGQVIGLALAAAVHLLHRVGRVVEPLPDEREADHLAVARDHRELARAQGGHVALHEVGVRGLAELREGGKKKVERERNES